MYIKSDTCHKMTIRKARFVVRKRRRHCRFGTGCIHAFSLFSIFCTGFCSVVAFMVLFVALLEPCWDHVQCATDNFCSVDTCTNNFCHHEYIKDCCNVDKDCPETVCHDVYCNKLLNKCEARKKDDGASCTDNNACTVNDQCQNGLCVGNTLTCNVNPCAEGVCHKTKGCLFTPKQDGTACDDGNVCTIGDQCFQGICASGINTDCTGLDGDCVLGICESTSGNCTTTSRVDGTTCSSNDVCVDHPTCTSGVCSGTEKTCFDNNPCTLDKCVGPSIGCMIQHNYSTGTCLPGCQENSACPTGFVCHDGTCIKLDVDNDVSIRFVNYEIENCSTTVNETGHRLLLTFAMDAEKDNINGVTYYRIVKEKASITTNTPQPLGFVDEVINLDSNVLTDMLSRSAFILTTACQPVTNSNCNTIFMNRKYEFDLKLDSCADITTDPMNCIDPNIHVQASVDVSINDCQNFNVYQVINTYGDAVLYYNNTRYTGLNTSNEINLRDRNGELSEKRLFVGIETNVYNNDNMRANIYSMRLCSPDWTHPLASCVTGENSSTCPFIGCYGWPLVDSPVKMHYDMLEMGYFTGIGEATLNMYGCYMRNIYHESASRKCQAPKCPSGNWAYTMDDGISITMDWTENAFARQDFVLVFDIVYKVNMCFNHLRSIDEINHQVGYLKLHK